MPLKEADLKNADSYKKASRQEMSKLAKGTAKFSIYKDVELPAAGGKKQKYPAFLALGDDTAIRKALAGKKLLCKGTCGMKDERIAFQPASGAVPYKILKVSLPLLVGKPVWIPTGQEEEEGEEKGGGAPRVSQKTPPPRPPRPSAPQPPKVGQRPTGAPKLSAASLSGAWKNLTKAALAYAAAHPQHKAALVREMSAISALLKANKAAEAKSRMDRVKTLLAAPPPPSKPVTKTGAAPFGAKVTARWNELLKHLRTFAAANPERKQDLVRASAGVAELVKARRFETAAKLMDRLDAMLKVNPKEKELRARYRAIHGRLSAALKDPARDASNLRAITAFIVEKTGKGDFDSAWKALQRLEAILAAKPKPPVESGKPGPTAG